MSDQSPNLALSYLQENQAQKHVTLNESLRRLDALVQLSVDHGDRVEPEGAEADGTRYIVSGTPSGPFAGQEGRIAALQDGAWTFIAPQASWLVWDRDAGRLLVSSSTAWQRATANLTADELSVNAEADTTNRLSLACPPSLFSHAGAGHQLKINKAAPGDTAALLFQTGLRVAGESGAVSFPSGVIRCRCCLESMPLRRLAKSMGCQTCNRLDRPGRSPARDGQTLIHALLRRPPGRADWRVPDIDRGKLHWRQADPCRDL